MALTATQIQTLIAIELRLQGDLEFAGLVPLWWDLEEASAFVNPKLRYLLVRRRALLYAIDKAAEQVDVSREVPSGGNVRVSGSQEGVRLAGLLTAAEAEIAGLEKRLAGNRGPKTGTIARQAPILRNDTVDLPVEASDRAFRGDPWRSST